MRILGAILLLALGLLGPARAEQIIWLTPAYPPAYILDRPDPDLRWYGDGFAQQIHAWFVERIPGYESEELAASLGRIMTLMQSSDRLYCLATTNPTAERAAFMVFSAALYLQPSNRIVVRSDRLALVAPHLDGKGRVDLPALMADVQAGGSIVAGRVYSAAIDRAVAQAQTLDRQSSIETPPRLLLAGHADWIIAYPREIEWAWRAGGGTLDAERPYRTYPIAGEPAFGTNHIGCTKSEAGMRFIERVDETIAAHPDRPWRDYMLAWLDRDDRAAVEAAQQSASR
jgi:uncharacterized protein (TIGR02285 family)